MAYTLLSAVFVGLGYGTFMSNGQAVTVKIVPVHRIGVATSTYFIALDMGLGFGPYILGAIKEVDWLYKHVPCYCCSSTSCIRWRIISSMAVM